MRQILKVSTRTGKGKQAAKKMRQAGKTPGIVYGHGEKTIGVTIDNNEFTMLIEKAKSESMIFDIEIDGKKKIPCIIKSIQKNSINDQLLHIDLQQIHLKEKIVVKIPIILKGEAPGVKQGGILDHHLREIEIKCLPDDVIPNIELDISQLKMGDTLHVSDLSLNKIEALIPKDIAIVSVLVPKEEIAAVPIEEAKEPELIREKKEEKDEGEKLEKEAKPEKPKEEKAKEKERGS